MKMGIDSENLWRARFADCGMSVETAAEWLDVKPWLLRSMEAGRRPVSRAVFLALALRSGDLSLIHRDWVGWSLSREGYLCHSAFRRGLAPGELLGLPYERALLRELRQQVSSLRAELEKRPRRLPCRKRAAAA